MIRICAHHPGGNRRTRHCYQIATQAVACDHALSGAQPFTISSPGIVDGETRSSGLTASTGNAITFDQPGWIGGAWRHVTARNSGSTYHIRIEGIGTFDVLNGGQLIGYGDSLAVGSQAWTEALFGPAMMLALALNGVWSLHASAVTFADRTIAFLGESGAGKSTLARYLGSQPGWTRVADDILPITHRNGTVWAAPHFPQLKLSTNEQPGANRPPRLPLHAIYLLTTATQQPESGVSSSVQIQPFLASQAMLTLLRHTVAARLFGWGLLGRHFSFARSVTNSVPVYQLAYPHDYACLPRVQATLESQLATHPRVPHPRQSPLTVST